MEYEQIKQLMDDMGNSKLSSLEINFSDGTKISMKKENEVVYKTVNEIDCEKSVSNKVQSDINVTNVNTQIKEQDSNFVVGNIVKSPMVGTFYSKPEPGAMPYVEVGKTVKKGDVLCIIEAMKLMNEIECEFDGKVLEIFVSDGEVVDFGKPLFKIG